MLLLTMNHVAAATVTAATGIRGGVIPLVPDGLTGDGRIDLDGKLEQLLDPSGKLDIAHVSSAAWNSRFAPLPGQLNSGYSDDAIWLRFSVTNPHPEKTEWWLEVAPGWVQNLSVYTPAATGGYQQFRGGTAFAFDQRQIAFRDPLFKVQLAAGATATIYLRLQTRGRIIANLTLWQPAAFISAASRADLGYGVYLGILALLVVTSFWFERAVQDRLYLYFGLYVACCFGMTAVSTGLFSQYVIPSRPDLYPRLSILPLIFGIVTCVQFFARFVGHHLYRPRLHRLFMGALWCWTLLLTAMVLLDHYREATRMLTASVAFVIVPLSVLLLFRPAIRSSNEVRYTFIAAGLLLAATILLASLRTWGRLPPSEAIQIAPTLATLILFLIVYYAITRRYGAMRKAKEQAQAAALSIAQRAEQELEQVVLERTSELLGAMHMLEQAFTQERSARQEQLHFISTISHELRTPLAIIDAATENMKRDAALVSPKNQLRLDKIGLATGRLSSLLEAHLSGGRFDTATPVVVPRPAALLPLLQDAVSAAQVLAQGHQIRIAAPEQIPEQVRADPDVMKLVLRTLVDNAVKYSPPHSSVSLHARAVADGWEIDVADQGPRIPAAEQEQIFERARRGSTAGQTSGSGIGLYHGRHMVELHGGTLNWHATSEADGNLFRIWLPSTLAHARHSAG